MDPYNVSFQGFDRTVFSLAAGPQGVFFRCSTKIGWWDAFLNASIGKIWDRFKTEQVTVQHGEKKETVFMRAPEVKRLALVAANLQKVWHSVHPQSAVTNVNVEKISNEKAVHSGQLKRFEVHAVMGTWENLHQEHYDWWMFPINKTSQGHGDEYAFSEANLEALRSDREFLASYRRGVQLQALAWGWNIEKGVSVLNPKKGQLWTGYGIRLAKMADSLWLMGEKTLFASLQQFAKERVRSGGMSEESLVLAALHMTVTDGGRLIPSPNPDLRYHEPSRHPKFNS
jgi:hypothetical protein